MDDRRRRVLVAIAVWNVDNSVSIASAGQCLEAGDDSGIILNHEQIDDLCVQNQGSAINCGMPHANLLRPNRVGFIVLA